MRSVFVPVLLLLPAFFGAWLASAGGRHAGGGFWAPHWATRSSFARIAALDSKGMRLAVNSAGRLWATGEVARSGMLYTVLRQSADNGVSWTPKAELPASPVSLALDASDTLYVLTKSTVPELKISRSSDEGASWSEVTVPGPYSSFRWQDLAVSPDGTTLYLAGIDKTESSWHWIIAKSDDAGASWTTKDRFLPATREMSEVTRIAVNWTKNTVWVLGSGYDTDWEEKWYVRKSADSGTTWSTSDLRTAGGESKANDIAWDDSGNLYVVGYEIDSSWNNSYWMVSRSSDEGATWTTVDYHLGEGSWSQALSIAIDSSGDIFVAGNFWRSVAEGQALWAVRKSTDGTTWTTIESYQRTPGKEAGAVDLAVDGASLFVIGTSKDGDGTPHWIVKRSGDQGTSFDVAEDYAPEGLRATSLGSSVMDASGALFVTGTVDSSHPFMLKSLDGGITWSGDLEPTAYNSTTYYAKLVLHPSTGALYALSQVPPYPYTSSIRKSTDGGATWSPVASTSANATSLHIAANGDLYLTIDDYSLSPRRWIVQRSQDDGQTWSTVDNYVNTTCSPRDITSGPGGFFAIGTCNLDSQPRRWTVRKSTDGTTWSSVDSYLYAAGKDSDPASIRVLANGVLIASGVAWDAAGKKHALIRRSADGGSTWTTVDNHFPDPLADFYSRDIAVDSSGTIYVAGYSLGTPGIGRVRVSADEGLTWRDSDRFSPGALLNQAHFVVASPVDAAVYAVGFTADSNATKKALIRRLR